MWNASQPRRARNTEQSVSFCPPPPKLESRIQQLSCEQSNVRQQNQQLRGLNTQLQQQLEGGREKLQATVGQLKMLERNAAQEQDVRQR